MGQVFEHFSRAREFSSSTNGRQTLGFAGRGFERPRLWQILAHLADHYKRDYDYNNVGGYKIEVRPVSFD